MILFLLIGLLVGVLSSLSGLGGGFLIVPWLIYMGKEAKMAVGTSFVFILLVAVSSMAAHFRLGNLDLKTGLLLGAGGIAGAQLGPLILERVSQQHFKMVFAVFLIGTGIWMFYQAKHPH